MNRASWGFVWVAACGHPEREIEAAAPATRETPAPIVLEEPPEPEAPALVPGVGTHLGSGGLGSRGTGGGGGGIGTGSSGYGSGGGRFVPKSITPLASIGGDTIGPGSPPLSKEWEVTGQNPTELTSRDLLSTFSIDVDTGAYTQARRMLQGGVLPPPESVRTEEFVNYQQYRYPEPEDGLPFAISVEGAPHPWTAGHHLLQVGIQGAHLEVEDARPVHLTFLVDTSGSMQHADRLPLAQRALHYLVDQLQPHDTVAIATYAGATRTVLEPTAAVNQGALHTAIDSLQSGGGTAMSSGMVLAYTMAERSFVAGEENRVLLLSDGDANIGATSHEAVAAELARYAKKGITLSTFGFGTGNYRDAMMEQLADDGDGNYTYVDGWDEAQRVFGEDLAATVRTIARDVKIQVRFDPDSVLAYTLVGYENRAIADRDFRNDAVDAGEVGAGHTVTALYDVVLRDRRDLPLATVQVRHKPPGPDVPATEQSVTLPVGALAPSFEAASANLRLAWGTAAFAEKLRGSSDLEEVDWLAIEQVVAGALRIDTARDDELLDLIRTASQLTERPGGGSLARSHIEEVVTRHLNQVRYCYQRRLVVDPALAGEVVVDFTIATDGTVSAANPRSTVPDPEVGACVTGRILRMQFPTPSGGPVAVSWPFVFSPG